MTWNAVRHHFHQCTKSHRNRNITPFPGAGTVCMYKTEIQKFPNTCYALPFSFSFLFRHFNLKLQFFHWHRTGFSQFLQVSSHLLISEHSEDCGKDWHTSFPLSPPPPIPIFLKEWKFKLFFLILFLKNWFGIWENWLPHVHRRD